MFNNPAKINAEEIGKLFTEKFKKMPKDANLAEAIPNAIEEILRSYGIEIPEQVKEKIKEYQSKIQVKN